MGITERQEKILNTVIEEYINLAQPVSSRLLEKKYKFGVCPATIRIEMQELTNKGYLYQPHTSAGRVPTDKGYRFFVSDLLEKEISNFENMAEIEKLLREEKDDALSFAGHLAKSLAQITSNLTAIHLLEKKFFWKEGWGGVLREPEFKDKSLIIDFAKFLENFEENVNDLKINSGIKIYIGRESPFLKAKDFSIISSRCYLPDREEAIISLFGPKRMDYDRNISLINSLTKLLGDF